ncbi:hypothetical protein U9M48_013750 [Paspalum notatum var. saurae]|uniref:Uncharacterized protein n=1 Tax=Paspalum notatum var. saurae TaxID=547442 RepID=A0AAQ3SZY9_PASNO
MREEVRFRDRVMSPEVRAGESAGSRRGPRVRDADVGGCADAGLSRRWRQLSREERLWEAASSTASSVTVGDLYSSRQHPRERWICLEAAGSIMLFKVYQEALI